MSASSPKYSICVSNLNTEPTVRRAMQSIIDACSGLDVEYVVVDQNSKDGSFEILQEFAESTPNFTLIQDPRIGRGIGRQIAAAQARGEYQIHHLDMDEFYHPILDRILDYYHNTLEKELGDCALVAALMIAKSEHIHAAGSFPDTVNNEEAMMNARLSARIPLIYMPIRFSEHHQHPRRGKPLGQFKEGFHHAREPLRIGALTRRQVFHYLTRNTWNLKSKMLATVPAVCGMVGMYFKPRYKWPLRKDENNETPFDYLVRRLGRLDEFVEHCGREYFTIYESELERAKDYPPLVGTRLYDGMVAKSS